MKEMISDIVFITVAAAIALGILPMVIYFVHQWWSFWLK